MDLSHFFRGDDGVAFEMYPSPRSVSAVYGPLGCSHSWMGHV